MLTSSPTDVLSHVAIRARSQGVLLATCFDEAELGNLEVRQLRVRASEVLARQRLQVGTNPTAGIGSEYSTRASSRPVSRLMQQTRCSCLVLMVIVTIGTGRQARGADGHAQPGRGGTRDGRPCHQRRRCTPGWRPDGCVQQLLSQGHVDCDRHGEQYEGPMATRIHVGLSSQRNHVRL